MFFKVFCTKTKHESRDPKSKAHEKHPIHGMLFSISRITAYKIQALL